ncbi:MAG: hypothetical protein ACRCZF_02295, partial [Gemmataceae bacterium]
VIWVRPSGMNGMDEECSCYKYTMIGAKDVTYRLVKILHLAEDTDVMTASPAAVRVRDRFFPRSLHRGRIEAWRGVGVDVE